MNAARHDEEVVLSATATPESAPVSGEQERTYIPETPDEQQARLAAREAKRAEILQLQEEDVRLSDRKIYELRTKLFQNTPDRVILDKRVAIPIPEGTIAEVNAMIDLHKRTKDWNREGQADAKTSSPEWSPGVLHGEVPTTSFPESASASSEAPAVISRKEIVAADMKVARRKEALKRAKMQAAKEEQAALESEVDAAFETLAPRDERSLPAPTKVKLPSTDASRWQ